MGWVFLIIFFSKRSSNHGTISVPLMVARELLQICFLWEPGIDVIKGKDKDALQRPWRESVQDRTLLISKFVAG